MLSSEYTIKGFHLFEDEIRLLTGQNEVTNTLVDLVVLHINKALHPYFAIEQLSLTWEELSAIDLYGCEFEDEYYQQVRCERKHRKMVPRNDRKLILTITLIKDFVVLFTTNLFVNNF